DQRRDAVATNIMRRDPHRFRIDVARDDATPPALGCPHGEDARAGAHIENAMRPARRHRIEHGETAACRRMLAGTERRRGIDRKRDAARRNAAFEMRAIDEEASDQERREARLIYADPVPAR